MASPISPKFWRHTSSSIHVFVTDNPSTHVVCSGLLFLVAAFDTRLANPPCRKAPQSCVLPAGSLPARR